MSLCTHPEIVHYAAENGARRCGACGDVQEAGSWRPSRDSNDPPFAYTDPLVFARAELGLGGVRDEDLRVLPSSMPHDQRIVLETFGLALMAATFEQTAAMKDQPLMFRVAHLAADSGWRFTGAIKVIVEAEPVQ